MYKNKYEVVLFPEVQQRAVLTNWRGTRKVYEPVFKKSAPIVGVFRPNQIGVFRLPPSQSDRIRRRQPSPCRSPYLLAFRFARYMPINISSPPSIWPMPGYSPRSGMDKRAVTTA